MHVAISGSSGLIGTALVARLRVGGHQVTCARAPPGRRRRAASGTLQRPPRRCRRLDGVDAVVNLAGAGINEHRWSDDYKPRDLQPVARPPTLLSPSDRRPSTAAERVRVRLGDRLLRRPRRRGARRAVAARPRVPRRPVRALGGGGAGRTRPAPQVAVIRTGIVLTPQGGALRKELPLFKFGLGGRFGNGRSGRAGSPSTTRSGRSSTCSPADAERRGEPDRARTR